MLFKVIGAVFVIVGCGGFGFSVVAVHRKETVTLRNLLSALELMEWELRNRLTPLPELCRITSEASKGIVKELFLGLAEELEAQIAPDVNKCIHAVLHREKDVPILTGRVFGLLDRFLGRFDLEYQLEGLASVRLEGERILADHISNQDNRLRCYQTLGLCAGAAMAILFV